jgi:hypothetical protein
MSKRHHKYPCKQPEEQGYHVHYYCEYTSVDDCHRHIIRGVTAPAPNKPCHKHEYKGDTTCNDRHQHPYCGSTGAAEPLCGGHVHNYSGTTACADRHKHHYCGTTDRERPYCHERRFCR